VNRNRLAAIRNSTACNEVRRGRLGWLIGVVGYWNLVSD